MRYDYAPHHDHDDAAMRHARQLMADNGFTIAASSVKRAAHVDLMIEAHVRFDKSDGNQFFDDTTLEWFIAPKVLRKARRVWQPSVSTRVK